VYQRLERDLRPLFASATRLPERRVPVHLGYEVGQKKHLPVAGAGDEGEFLPLVHASAIPDRIEAFQHGLRELGYLEGKNIHIEYRWADGKIDRLSPLAAELVRLNVKLIVAGGPQATRRFKEATSTIPIVMGYHNDPVGSWLVANLARPGSEGTHWWLDKRHRWFHRASS